MANSFSGTNPQPSDFVSQLSQMQQSGAALGTSIANNAEAGATTASNIGLQQAQTGLVQQQGQAEQIQNAMSMWHWQMQQQAMSYAQNELSQMSTDAGQPSGVGPDQSSDSGGTSDASGPAAIPPGAGGSAPSAPATSAAGTPAGGSAAPATNAPASGTQLDFNALGLDPGHIRLAVAKNFMVPLYTPLEQSQIAHARAADMAAGIAGIPMNTAGTLDAQRQQRVASQTSQAQQKASQQYELYTGAVVNSPAGTALQALARTGPGGTQVAQKLEAIAKQNGNGAPWLDQQARAIASETANELYHFTGRPMTIGTDNIRYDDTGQPVAGTPRLGINPNTVVQAAGRSANAGAQMVEVPNGSGGTRQVPLWQANGYSSLEAFKAAAGIPQTPGMAAPPQPTGGAAPSPGGAAPSPGGAAPSPGGAAPPGSIPGIVSQTNTPLTPQQVQQLAPVAAKYGTDPQTLHTSLTDSGYRLQLPTAPQGQTLSPDQDQIRKDYAEHVKSEQDDASEEIDGASQSLQYLKAAQQIMSNGGADVTGLYGPVKAALSRVFPGGVNATNYQEAVKYLGNAALQNARTTYGSRMTQTEVKLQKDELSPSATMQPAAVNSLVGEMSRIAQYTIDRGQRLRPYLAAGNDARYFDQWNQQYYPRQSVVNNPASGQGNTAAPAAQAAPAAVTSQADYSALPAGARYSFNGRVGIKGGK